jgi:hypothetical protein
MPTQFGVTGSRAIFCISGPSLRSAYIRLPGRRSWKRAGYLAAVFGLLLGIGIRPRLGG